MTDEDDAAYHDERAKRELHLGLTALSMPVARAHLRLSSLHMQRALEMRTVRVKARPLCIVD